MVEKNIYVLAEGEYLYGTERALLGILERKKGQSVVNLFGGIHEAIKNKSYTFSINSKKNFSSIFFGMFKLLFYFRKSDCDCITSLNYYITIFLILTKLIHRKKIVAWEHAEWNYPKKYVQCIKFFLYRFLSSIVVVNERDRLYWSKINKRVFYIENIVFLKSDSELFSPDDVVDIDVLFCGRFSEEKGFYFIDEIMRVLNSRLKQKITFLLIGGCHKFKKYENVDVHVKGYVDDPVSYIYKSKVLINPSIKESYGISVHQAIAMNVPVVCWDSTSSSESIMGLKLDYISLVKSYDIDKYCEKILLFLSEKNERKGKENLNDLFDLKNKKILFDWKGVYGSI